VLYSAFIRPRKYAQPAPIPGCHSGRPFRKTVPQVVLIQRAGKKIEEPLTEKRLGTKTNWRELGASPQSSTLHPQRCGQLLLFPSVAGTSAKQCLPIMLPRPLAFGVPLLHLRLVHFLPPKTLPASSPHPRWDTAQFSPFLRQLCAWA
jgi:hypothetical protein